MLNAVFQPELYPTDNRAASNRNRDSYPGFRNCTVINWLLLVRFAGIAVLRIGRDRGMRCYEAVICKMDENIRADASASRPGLATGPKILSASPLTFGNGNTEGQRRNPKKRKKPALWGIGIVAVICFITLVCLIANPVSKNSTLMGAEYRIDEILYRIKEYDSIDSTSARVCFTADSCLYACNGDDKWEWVGVMEPYTLSKKELENYTERDSGWMRRYSTGEITDSYILRIQGETSHNFFLAFLTKSGDTLIGYGIGNISGQWQSTADDTRLYWLCRLEKTSADR